MKKEKKEELKQQLEQASKCIKGDSQNFIEREAQKTIKEWKEQKTEETIIKEFAIPKKLINITLKTTEYDGLIFYGEGGLGKTFLTINEVKKILKPFEWEYFNGYSTPLSIYEILYFNRNKKLLILDDIEGLFNNPLSVAILKGALWDSNGKKLVQYNSKSDKVKGLPSTFEFKAKIFILCNKIYNSDDVTIRALINRTIPYEVKFNYSQKIEILNRLIERRKDLTDKQIAKAKELIKKETSIATKNLSFRTLKKVIAFIKEDRDNCVSLFRATNEIDTDIQIVSDLVNEYPKQAKIQIRIFEERTGKSRRTFFNIKKKIKCNSATD